MSMEPRDRPAIPASLAREVEALQVAELYRNLAVSAPAAFFGTLLCTAVFLEDGLDRAHVAWLAYGTVVAVLRMGLCWAIRRQSALGWNLEPRQWARLAVAGNFLAGVQWGLLGTWLYPDVPGFRQAFAMMVITCFVGGSITAYAPVRWAHPALAIPATIPPTIYIFFVQSGVHVSAGLTALFFSAMVLYYAVHEHGLVARRLRADTRLRREIQDLVSDVDAARRAPPREEALASRA